MKILFISDTHGLHERWEKQFPIPEVDMIVHSGDLTNIGTVFDFQLFFDWFKNLPIKYKVCCAGNHDWGLDNHNRSLILDMIKDSGIYYLEDSGVEIEGINFWGSPVTPPFFNWAFMREPDEIIKHWDMIPNDTDVLITHAPARGILDYVPYGGGKSTGCPLLLDKIHEIKALIHCCGHIHPSYGFHIEDNITFINAAIINDRYEPVRGGHIIEINTETKEVTIL